MTFLRSARSPAILLLLAAGTGLLLANSSVREAAFAVADARLGIPGLIDLPVRRWVSDGLLALFFFVAAIELRGELTGGMLASPRRAVLPAIAAVGGVAVPAAVYLAVAGGPATSAGWPVPTATDIAFALGVLAVFGRGLPSRVRVFLLALAILDDIVGIGFIAVLFTASIDLAAVFAATALIAVFALCSRFMPTAGRGPIPVVLLVVLLASGVGAWYAVHASGVHATIAGVALGLVMAPRSAQRVRHVIEPWVNAVVLPLFALSAALVTVPAVSPQALSPAFWGVLIALPLGKLGGIALAGALAQRALRVPAADALALGDLLAVGALGGVGFTVSLLLGELAFADAPGVRDQVVLGVLAGSAISLVLAAMLVSWRAWLHRRPAPATP